MIKIYKVDTFEKFEHLLKKLHERGAKWGSGDALDDEAMAKMFWSYDCCNGMAVYKEGNKVTLSDIEEIEDEIECFERKGQEYTIIEDVKLPNSKQTDSNQVEQPSHYIGDKGLEVREIEENFLVRYQDGHLAHLAGALLEYLLRAPSKGKLAEDIQKVKYLANEMAEYVEKVKEAR